MALRAITIPFAGGQDTTIDKHLAGLGKFRQVINGRLDADGRLVSRAGYTALGVTSYGAGSHAAYDLFELDGRLCSLGDRFGVGYPTDVFEFVDGGAAVWRPTGLGLNSDVQRLPRATHLRELARPPDQEGGVSGFDVAALGGYVLLVYNDDGAPPLGAALLIKADSGQSILFESFPGDSTTPRNLLQVIALTDRFWAIGVSTDTQTLSARHIDPETDVAWAAGSTTLATDVDGYSVIAAARVAGAEQFVTVTRSSTNSMLVRRFDEDGVLIVPSGGQYAAVAAVNAQFLAIEASSGANQIVVAAVNGDTLELYSWNLSTGAALATPPDTPTEVATETCTNVALVRVGPNEVVVLATVTTVGTPDVTRIFRWSLTPSTGAFGTGVPAMALALASGAVSVDDANAKLVLGVTTDDNQTTPNMLIEWGEGDDMLAPIAAKDLGFASPAVNGQIPRLAVDTSTTPDRYYWVHGVQSADGASIPVVCELRLNDPGRRQTARVGRGVVISGAMPCWYDGGQLVELGLTQRPRIVSLTASDSSGELSLGATYHYKVVQSWFDILGRLHRSCVSLPEEVELTSSQDTVTAVIASVHSSRANLGSAPQGSVLRTELYRTRAIVTTTPPDLIGTQNVDPPLSSLDGLTIYIYTESGSGGAQATVTFDSGDTTLAAILAQISAQAAGKFTVTSSVGAVALTAVAEGSESYIQINGDVAALDILGFVDSQSANGTTEIEEGDVFHLTATEYTTVGDPSGDRITVVDVRDDDADDAGIQSQAVLYTLLDSPLDDFSPLPSDRVWSGIERVEVAGHPQRETWTSSKLLEAGFAPAFAEQGRPGFSGELVEGIEAVITQQLSKLYLTRKSIWQVDGEGPALNGQGAFSRANRIFTDGGLVEDGWRSLLETAQGIWMQLGKDKLYLMRPGSAPTWEGFPIRELLRDFPVIAGATLTSNDQVAAFALQSEDGTDGRIALFDLRRGIWTVDDPDAVPVALADYQGRLCFADDAGIVHMQDEAAGSGTFVPLTVDTAFATTFGVAGQGGVVHVFAVGELLGECTVQLKADYDDGAGFVDAGSFVLTAANGYTVGQTVREQFDLALEDCQQFALELLTTGTTGSAGLALIALEVHAERDAGPGLLGDSFRR